MAGIEVLILAAESMGVRSMATKVTTPDVSIMIDAGASLGPRFGLQPHPLEYGALSESRRRIREASEGCEVMVVTHYHHDHYSPPFDNDYIWTWSDRKVAEELYRDKVVIIKDPREDINFSQRVRAYHLVNFLEGISREVRVADSASLQFGETRVGFSEPVFHGEEGSRLGYVLMVHVESGDRSFLFASDVQGPISERTKALIMGMGASTIFVGGPPTYLHPSQMATDVIARAIRNLSDICERTGLTIVDHHLMRALDWRKSVMEAEIKARSAGNDLVSAASFSGRKEDLLEARRERLYEDIPPGNDFISWTRKRYEERRKTPPPL